MLRALGSMEQLPFSNVCCDVCSSDNIPVRLDFEGHLISVEPPVRKKPRRAIRKVDENNQKRLKENLKAEREAYMLEHPSFQMLGLNFVCADSAIDKICENSKFINSVDDLDFVNIKQEIKSRFISVIHFTFSDASTHQHTSYHPC